tara:strand:- start:172339 stop:172761 length:423 start_codon:yes stop_codon:yes gene_type:complete
MNARTKTGAMMNTQIKNALIDVLSNPEHEGETQKEIAKLIGVTPKTVQNYLTIDVWQEIHQRRLKVINNSLELVDRAVFAKAIKGDMTAAKLLYTRWDEARQKNDMEKGLITENNEDDIAEIERLQKDIQELENDDCKEP